LQALVEQRSQPPSLGLCRFLPFSLRGKRSGRKSSTALLLSLFEFGLPEDLEREELEFLDDDISFVPGLNLATLRHPIGIAAALRPLARSVAGEGQGEGAELS